MCNWILVRKCFGTKYKTEISNSLSVFYLVPKHFRCPNWVTIADDPALNIEEIGMSKMIRLFRNTRRFIHDEMTYCVMLSVFLTGSWRKESNVFRLHSYDNTDILLKIKNIKRKSLNIPTLSSYGWRYPKWENLE